MPRDGSGIYSIPLGTDGVPDQTIESTKYNGFAHDLEQDNNIPRPIVAGGTGATNADQALVNLSGEKANQLVTNYNAFPFVSGSFYSAAGATGAPTSNGFYGICVVYLANQYVTLEGRDVLTGVKYTRRMMAGLWDASWTLSADPNDKVSKAGDNMTGTLGIGAPTRLDQLHVAGTNTNTNTSFGGQLGIVLQNTNTTAGNYTSIMNYNSTSAPNAGIYFKNIDHAFAGQIDFSTRSLAGTLGARMSITKDGNVTIPGTVVLGASAVAGNAADMQVTYNGPSIAGLNFRPVADNSNACIFTNAANTLVGTIFQAAAATAYNTSSDVRLKEDFETFDAARIIDDTEVFSFRWKATGDRSYGVSAQQAAEVFPQAVTYLKEQDWYGIDYSKYVPVLIQEIKALRARLAQLEGRLAVKPA